DSIVEAGVHDIGIIVGDTADEVKAEIADAGNWGDDVTFTFIQQGAPLGLAHAVLMAPPFLGADRFIMVLGGNLIGESLAPLVRDFADAGCPYACHILLKEVPNPSQFGVAELASLNGAHPAHPAPAPDATPLRVKRLIEKPAVPPSNLALVGIYLFDQSIF